MSRESGDQPTQRTVAELLAQYGGKPAGGRRRRHRRPDDEAETGPDASSAESDIATTAPQAIIARIQSETPGTDWEAAKRNGRSHAATERNGSHDVPPRGPRPPEAKGPPAARTPTGYNRVAQPPTWPPPPAPQAPGPPGPRRPPALVESPTHQFAAVEPDRRPADDADDRAAVAEDDRGYDAPDGDADLDADEFDDDRSPGQQWLAMAGQVALGVVGGAVVWLIFNWLWAEVAAVALIVALAVIVGLVWIVRRMRRTEDLQTMVLAVLVGLVVTVSPAALLLLSR